MQDSAIDRRWSRLLECCRSEIRETCDEGHESGKRLACECFACAWCQMKQGDIHRATVLERWPERMALLWVDPKEGGSAPRSTDPFDTSRGLWADYFAPARRSEKIAGFDYSWHRGCHPDGRAHFGIFTTEDRMGDFRRIRDEMRRRIHEDGLSDAYVVRAQVVSKAQAADYVWNRQLDAAAHYLWLVEQAEQSLQGSLDLFACAHLDPELRRVRTRTNEGGSETFWRLSLDEMREKAVAEARERRGEVADGCCGHLVPDPDGGEIPCGLPIAKRAGVYVDTGEVLEEFGSDVPFWRARQKTLALAHTLSNEREVPRTARARAGAGFT